MVISPIEPKKVAQATEERSPKVVYLSRLNHGKKTPSYLLDMMKKKFRSSLINSIAELRFSSAVELSMKRIILLILALFSTGAFLDEPDKQRLPKFTRFAIKCNIAMFGRYIAGYEQNVTIADPVFTGQTKQINDDPVLMADWKWSSSLEPVRLPVDTATMYVHFLTVLDTNYYQTNIQLDKAGIVGKCKPLRNCLDIISLTDSTVALNVWIQEGQNVGDSLYTLTFNIRLAPIQVEQLSKGRLELQGLKLEAFIEDIGYIETVQQGILTPMRHIQKSEISNTLQLSDSNHLIIDFME